MKKQLHKIKIAAENLSRFNKLDKNSDDLLQAEKEVDQYKDVLEKISKKFLPNTTSAENRTKKVHEYRLGQTMEDSAKDLQDGLLKDILTACARVEKTIATEIVSHEINVENAVTKKLTNILETNINTIQKQKRVVNKLMQDNKTAKQNLQAAVRLNESTAKITQLREEQEEVENKLEKERDVWAAEMFDLISEEGNMAVYIVDYIEHQRMYYSSALHEIDKVMTEMKEKMNEYKPKNKNRIPLSEHLDLDNRCIAYVIELCVCYLFERGLKEEGLLRISCGGSKLRRIKTAIAADLLPLPLTPEYQDVHVVASLLKSYLRELPDPLLTFNLYHEFSSAAMIPNERDRKLAIRHSVSKLPDGHYENLKYLMKFLELLAQNSNYNKMNSHNLAIVMSPNLLWSQIQSDADIAQSMNNTTAVNTVIESMISDWEFYFGGGEPVNFYVTLAKEDILGDTFGFPIERNDSINQMTRSINITSSTPSKSSDSILSTSADAKSYQTHSRNSSHDASQVLLEDSDTGMKRSQSSSSFSDSSPQHNSPKLPVRRKHNKSVAPTPPQLKNGPQPPSAAAPVSTKVNLEHHFGHMDLNEEKGAFSNTATFKTPSLNNKKHDSSETPTHSKPDKPPRPVAPPNFECQTLNRHVYKNNKTGSTGGEFKPTALPRSILNVTKSTEDLTDNKRYCDSEERIQVRDRPGKPAIPERPTSLMRPPCMKGSLQDVNSGGFDASPMTSTPSHIRKTSSFRNNANLSSNSTNVANTSLRRTHMYNVDKQQVSIINVDENGQNRAHESGSVASGNGKCDKEKDGKSTNGASDKKLVSDNNEISAVPQSIPPSPRGFDAKIKRPQIVPPPPPNRPKSDGGGDSTNF